MDAKQRKCCRCGKPTDVNPKTGKNYVMCPTCREKDSIRKKSHTTQKARNRDGINAEHTAQPRAAAVWKPSTILLRLIVICIAARNAVSKYVTNFITVLGVEQNWKQRGDRRCL